MPRQPREPEPVSGLSDTLKRSQRAPFAVPADVDEAIGRAARRSLGRGTSVRIVARWAALAAVIGLAAWLGLRALPGRTPEPQIVGDLDRSGRVDVLDAYLLARHIESGSPVDGSDMNGDGLVDAADVDLIAAMAVTIGEGA